MAARKTGAAPATIDEMLAELQPRTATARVLFRQDMLSKHAELEAELARTVDLDERENRIPEAIKAAEKVQRFEADIEKAKVPFTFKQIGRRAWADLIAKHPPSKDQRDAARRQNLGVLDHDPETFPVAAVAASCVTPVLTVVDVQRLEEALNQSQWQLLWVACLDANLGGTDDPKSLTAGFVLRLNGESEKPPTSSASRAASSSAES